MTRHHRDKRRNRQPRGRAEREPILAGQLAAGVPSRMRMIPGRMVTGRITATRSVVMVPVVMSVAVTTGRGVRMRMVRIPVRR